MSRAVAGQIRPRRGRRRHVRTEARQRQRHRPADAHRRAGHHGDAVGEQDALRVDGCSCGDRVLSASTGLR